MSNLALYRKFRPMTFDDVKGQDEIVTTLKNQVKSDRLGHAYLFMGTRGTGKTSVAKVLARAVNCTNPTDDGNPCCECENCKSILAGNNMNVVELDAASHRSVEDIKNIIEQVEYPPTNAAYRVFIIDEVHMITQEAFNALLKTLEEPPEYVLFILATTEVHKIPQTIKSRCQRYDFRRISVDTIAEQLSDIARKESVVVEDKALRYIAKLGDGSMRDALSLLDRCIAFHLGEDLTYDRVLGILGAVDQEVFSKLTRCIINRDVAGSIAQLEELVSRGRDLQQFVVDYVGYLRNLMLVKTDVAMEDVLEVTSENMKLLKEESDMVDDATLLRFVRIFSDLATEIRYSTQKRVLIEIALIRLCRPQMEQNYDAIVDRIEVVEKKLENGIPMANATMDRGVAGTEQAMAQAVENNQKQVTLDDIPKAKREEIMELAKNWDEIVPKFSPSVRLALKDAYPTTNEQGEFVLCYDILEGSTSLNDQILLENLDEVEQIIEQEIGKRVTIRVVRNTTGVSSEQTYPDVIKLCKEMDIPMSEEDF